MQTLTTAIDRWLAATFNPAPARENRKKELSSGPGEARTTSIHDWLAIDEGEWKKINCLQYQSEIELKKALSALDQTPDTGLVVVLELSERIQASLKDIARRANPAGRLVVVSDFNCWPGSDSPIDLLRSRAMLNWNEIEIRRSERFHTPVQINRRREEGRLCALFSSE